MTKTETIIALLLAKDCIERHKNFDKVLFNIMVNDLFGLMGENKDIEQLDLDKPHLKEVLNDIAYLLSNEQMKARHAKAILEAAWKTECYKWDIIRYILDSKMFEEISIDSVISEVIKENAQAWEDFKGGKKQAMGRLIGSVMKKTKGKADPEEVRKIFEGKSEE